MKPFIKWAGGKTQLLPVILKELQKNINKKTYVEPFLGGGALFLYLLEKDSFDRYIINDINSKLINLYLVIRDNIDLLINSLNNLKCTYKSLSDEQRKKMYYEIRYEFNNLDIDINKIELAAYFIFLNKTCFNGLYRENKKGEFNTSIGSYEKTPDMFDEKLLRKLSLKLNEKNEYGEFKTLILNKSFEELEKYIDEKCFVYMDPPYRPITKGGFNNYDKSGFNDEFQEKLAKHCTNLSQKGAKLMLSNSDPKNLNENDDFFDELYKDFHINHVYAHRRINSKANKRGNVSELLITNYN